VIKSRSNLITNDNPLQINFNESNFHSLGIS
jgi:hypothetical protein